MQIGEVLSGTHPVVPTGMVARDSSISQRPESEFFGTQEIQTEHLKEISLEEEAGEVCVAPGQDCGQ
jgi:hypothetical protein